METERRLRETGIDLPDFGATTYYGAGYGKMKPFHQTGNLVFLSGHIPERDGIAAGLMLLELLATERVSVNKLIARLEKEFGIKLPKGASEAVEAAAREFIVRHGVENLPKVAKMHFRTALRVQGLPEPQRKQWPRSASKSDAR